MKIPPFNELKNSVGEEFHLVKNGNKIEVTFENWMKFTIKDFSSEENMYLVPGFAINVQYFMTMTDVIQELVHGKNAPKPESEEDQQNFAKGIFELITETIQKFINIAMNCIEDYPTFDNDLLGRFAGYKADKSNEKEYNPKEYDLQKGMSHIFDIYNFSIQVIRIMQYSFLIGGKEFAERMINKMNQAKMEKGKLPIGKELNLDQLMKLFNNPNVHIDVIAHDDDGNPIHKDKEYLLQVLKDNGYIINEISDEEDEDKYGLKDMKPIGRA